MRSHAFIELGKRLKTLLEKGEKDSLYPSYQERSSVAFAKNGWFTSENIKRSFEGIIAMTEEEKMSRWLTDYSASDKGRSVGIVMAGNIPLVGFHDLMCVLLSGNKVRVKMSSDDSELLPFLLEILFEFDQELKDKVEIVEKLSNCDAVIATGSNNSARYFEYYFKNMPHIIRKNRTSLAILDGTESEDELKGLGEDIFSYFGLGCRNISKIFIPQDFDLNRIFGAIVDQNEVINNKKYANNYEYYKAIYLMNSDDLLENGFVLFKEDESMHSPVSMLFYERYQNMQDVLDKVEHDRDKIQCLVGKQNLSDEFVPFGKAQYPEPWDYADGVDTMRFLTELH